MALHKRLLDDFFSAVTSFGHPVFYVLVILILLKFNAPLAITLAFALLAVELLCIFIKLVYRKERPLPQSRDNFFDKIDANSFPSVHSARIALLVTITVSYYREMSVFVLGMIIMLGVGYSRIYLGRHYLKDVLAGFCIGIIIGIIIPYIGI